MKNKKKIKIYLVEDDPVQLQVLKDRFQLNNPEYLISDLSSGEHLLKELHKSNYHRNTYVILDYYLQSNENPEALNGSEVIELLNEQYQGIKIILFSAYEADEGKSFNALQTDGKIISFIKKSEHAFSYLVNAIRLDYIQSEVKHKKKRLMQFSFAFIGLLLFLTTYTFILVTVKGYHL